MTLSREEQETCILFNAANRETVFVFSDDPTWQKKLEKAGAVVTKIHLTGGKEYELQYRQITVRKLAVKKSMTDEQRQAAKERLKNMRKARKIK